MSHINFCSEKVDQMHVEEVFIKSEGENNYYAEKQCQPECVYTII